LYRATPHRAARLLRDLVVPWWRDVADLEGLPPDWSGEARRWADVSPGVAYAVDTALWDLRSRVEGRSVADVIGGARRSRVDVTQQLFIEEWIAAEAELKSILARGTRRVKLKIGRGPATDLAFVRRVQAFVGPQTALTVDANRAYSLAAGAELYRCLADLGVVTFEEPLRPRDWAGLRRLREDLGVPVMLDESVLSLEDLRTATQERALDVLNVKLTRVGGITLALEYIRLCLESGIEVSIGCTEDLGIGTAAIVHLAATLGTGVPVEGLGPLRLGFDVVQPSWVIEDGAVKVPAEPGLGVGLASHWVDTLPKRVRVFDLLDGRARVWAFSHYWRLRQRAENARLRLLRRFG